MATDIFYFSDRLGKLDDYTETVIKHKPEELVLMNHLKHTYPGMGAVRAWERNNELEGKQAKNYSAVAEGVDKTADYTHRSNTIIKSMLENARSNGYQISREAIRLNGGRIKENELATLIRRDASDFARSIEHVIGSKQECVQQTSTATVTKTRGLMCWLQNTQHTVMDVPAAFRPVAELQVANTATLSEDDFKAKLLAARQNAGRTLHLTGFVGLDLKLAFAAFLGLLTNVNNVKDPATEISQIVDFLRYDTGDVKLIACDGIDCDTTTLEPGTLSGHSGAFIELEHFQLEFAQPITHEDQTNKLDNGGGPRGYHSAMFRLNCTGLLGSFRVTKKSA